MKANKNKSVSCGDWHLGWGFGGNDKIGKLSVNEDGVYTWKGSSQGRHGQKWNKGAYITFKLNDKDGVKVIESNGSHPRWTEIMKSVNELNK